MAEDEEKVLGLGESFEFEGKTYKVSPLKFKHQAQFVAWLKKRARTTIEDQREDLSEAEYQRRMDRLDDKITAGDYSFGGTLSIQAANSPDGMKELMRLSLLENHPEVDDAFMERLVMAKATEAAHRALKRANADPPLTPARPASNGSHSEMSAPSSATTPSGLPLSKSGS